MRRNRAKNGHTMIFRYAIILLLFVCAGIFF